MENYDKIYETADELSALSLPEYDALPQIDLYMDQVIGYLNRLLCRVCRSEDGMPLTKNRINNYVKDGHVERPIQKKYDRDQLAVLYMLCCAKQTLSISEASALLSGMSGDGIGPLYDRFCKMQSAAFAESAKDLAAVCRDRAALREKALELTLRSTAQRYLAEEIISVLEGDRALSEKDREKQEKKEKKDKKQREKS